MTAQVIPLRARRAAPDSAYLDEVFGPRGYLARLDPNYETRPGQLALARAVDRALRDGGALVAEGPCGTGKSKGYAVPASYYAAQGKRVAIVTATIVLQEQLVAKDLPEVARAVPWRFSFALLKGRGNYLCNERRVGDPKGLPLEQRPAFDRVQRWAAHTPTGDKSELPFAPPEPVWQRFTVDSDDCKGKDCDCEAECFYGRARAAAVGAGVLVTNYHVLFADAYLRSIGAPGILPRIDALICDEAHEMPDIARDFFGATIAPGLVTRVAKFVREDIEPAGPTVEELEEAQRDAEARALQAEVDGREYFEQVRRWTDARVAELRKPKRPDPPSWRIPLDAPGYADGAAFLAHIERAAARAGEVLTHLDGIEKFRALTRDERKRRARVRTAARKFTKAASWLAEFQTLSSSNIACWVEATPSVDRVRLEARPVQVAAIVRELLESVPATVLTSATLTVGGNFAFLERETGVRPTERLVVESPFDFPSRCAVVVPRELPMPDDKAWPEACAAAVARVVEAADGRTLALFSSRTARDFCFERMPIGDRRWLRQGDLPPRALCQTFRDDERSVLFGTKSFWTGIDVPGDSLVAVVIDRVPFPQREDPVVRRIHQLDPENAFWDYDLPKALMQLRQGFGRLIRSRADYGVVVILDRRITSKTWRRVAWDSLPTTSRGHRLEDVPHLLRGLRENATGVAE